MRVRVDIGTPAARVALGLCACGYRGLAVSHLAALERLAAHEQQTHPEDRHARAALASYRRRHAAAQAS